MTTFQIVAFYIALHLILAPILMFRVGQVRIKEKISLGDGNSPALFARIRAHGNYVETAPFALIGLFALAMMNAHPIALHLFGSVFLFGRLLHAHGMAQKNANGKGRVIGMMMTLFTFFGTAVYLLYLIFTFTIN
ncbi:MAPEG family protein [Hellea balneolensis]|uniref:MAPEG family protein n=1 Tax=Hellea balneolensis TaxID=287478 RepID=UPI0004253FC2|nr:MAPEG family protein [Hellea balneolensis]